MEARPDASLLATTQAGLDPFHLYRPETVEDAMAAMAAGQPPVCFYAGGTDIFAAFREGLRPGSLIWLDRLPDRSRISVQANRLTLGAGVTHMQAVADPALDEVPGLASAWRRIATVRIRRHATLGGNLMARRPRYELSILLSALSARATLASGGGLRDVPVEALWDLPANRPELLVSVSIPLNGAPRLDYARDLRPTMTQALCLRDPGTELPACRAVVATEYLRPYVTDLSEGAVLGLPDGFGDAIADPHWLARVSATQFTRQMERLAAR